MTAKTQLHVAISAPIAGLLYLVGTPALVILLVLFLANLGLAAARENEREQAYRLGCQHTARVWSTYMGDDA